MEWDSETSDAHQAVSPAPQPNLTPTPRCYDSCSPRPFRPSPSAFLVSRPLACNITVTALRALPYPRSPPLMSPSLCIRFFSPPRSHFSPHLPLALLLASPSAHLPLAPPFVLPFSSRPSHILFSPSLDLLFLLLHLPLPSAPPRIPHPCSLPLLRHHPTYCRACALHRQRLHRLDTCLARGYDPHPPMLATCSHLITFSYFHPPALLSTPLPQWPALDSLQCQLVHFTPCHLRMSTPCPT